MDSTSGSVDVTWEDGHVSVYDLEWLRERRFTESARQERDSVIRLTPKTWGSEMLANIPTDTFDNVRIEGSVHS